MSSSSLPVMSTHDEYILRGRILSGQRTLARHFQMLIKSPAVAVEGALQPLNAFARHCYAQPVTVQNDRSSITVHVNSFRR